MKKRILFIGMVMLFVFSAKSVFAQQTMITAQVEQIAGNVIYLNIGSDQGLSQGDTLFVYRDKSYLGSLQVISAASRMSSSKFTDRPFSLTRGQLIQVKKMQSGRKPAISNTANPVSNKSSEDITRNQPIVRQQTVHEFRIRPNVTGGIQFGSNMMYSSTRPTPVGNENIKRTFITTYTGLQTRVRNLPNQFSLNMNMQWNYRYASQKSILPSNAFRIFQFQVNKKFGKSPINLSVGRFYNYYEPFSGFWDGAMLRVGNDSYGFGLISGFDPIRSDEGFSSSLPKSSFYTYFNYRNNRFYSESEISVNAEMPKTNGWNNHYYAGWHQQFRYKGSSLMSNIQVDQNPATKKYIFSQINFRANVNLTDFATLYGVYNRRKPYNIWQIGTPISYLRTQWTGGLSLQFGNNTVGGDYTLNQSDVSRNSFTYSGYAYVPDLGFWGLGLNLSAFYWTDKTFKSMLIAPGFTKKVGHGQMTLTYRFYNSEYFSRMTQTHSLSLQYNVLLFKKWYFNTQVLEQYGQLLNTQQIFIGITKNF